MTSLFLFSSMFSFSTFFFRCFPSIPLQSRRILNIRANTYRILIWVRLSLYTPNLGEAQASSSSTFRRLWFWKRKICYPIQSSIVNNFFSENFFLKGFVRIGDCKSYFWHYPQNIGKNRFLHFLRLSYRLQHLIQQKRYCDIHTLGVSSTN